MDQHDVRRASAQRLQSGPDRGLPGGTTVEGLRALEAGGVLVAKHVKLQIDAQVVAAA